ncbi:hypothetical protein ACOMHN_017476 [Nucella lapillus]
MNNPKSTTASLAPVAQVTRYAIGEPIDTPQDIICAIVEPMFRHGLVLQTNRIIDIIGDIIRGQILAEVKSAKHFTLMADEATDAGNWEQLSVVLRFVDSKNAIREEFLAFLQCESITGEALAHKILQCLNEWGLDASNIRGQGYDGASNMAGKFKGVKARILEDNEKALYFHCAAHCLSLCVVKLCEISQVRNMLGVLKDIAMFFNFSLKRQRKLEDVIDAALPDNKKAKLVNLCKTRWVEKHAAFESFAAMYQVLYDCVGQMTEDRKGWDTDTLTSSLGFLHSLSNGDFLVAFVVVRKCLQYLKPLTVNLQKRAHDIVAAYTEITDEAIETLSVKLQKAVETINERLESLSAKSEVVQMRAEVKDLTDMFKEKIEGIEGRLLDVECKIDNLESVLDA